MACTLASRGIFDFIVWVIAMLTRPLPFHPYAPLCISTDSNESTQVHDGVPAGNIMDMRDVQYVLHVMDMRDVQYVLHSAVTCVVLQG